MQGIPELQFPQQQKGNTFDLLGNVMKIQEMSQRKNIFDLQQQEVLRKEKARNAFSRLMQGDETAMQDLAATDPETVFQLQKMQREQRKENMGAKKDFMDLAGASMGHVLLQMKTDQNPETIQAAIDENLAAIKQLYPEEAQKYGLPDTMSIPQFKALTAKTIGIEKLDQIFGPGKWNADLQPVVGPDGKEMLLQTNSRGELRPAPGGYAPINKAGISATLPDGTEIRVGGSGKGGPTGLQPATQKKVEEDLLLHTKGLSDTITMEKSFKPEFQTYAKQWENTWFTIKDKAGGWLGNLSEDDKKKYTEMNTWMARAGAVSAKAYHDLAGSALTPLEAEKFGLSIVDPKKDGPIEAQTKMKEFSEMHKRAVARLNYIRKYGMSIQNAEKAGALPSLEAMDEIMRSRGNQLYQEVVGRGIDPEKAVEVTKRQLAQEFGLVY